MSAAEDSLLLTTAVTYRTLKEKREGKKEMMSLTLMILEVRGVSLMAMWQHILDGDIDKGWEKNPRSDKVW